MNKPHDTKQKLLDTAIDLVWQSSYSNVGVNEICEKAGVTKGCFYHYFDSKAALFQAASEHAWEKMKSDMDAIFSPEHDALTQLVSWLDYIIEKQRKNLGRGNPVSGCPFFTSGAQCGSEEQVVRQAALKYAEKAILYNTALVRALQAEGHLEGRIDPVRLGRMMSHYVQGLLLYGRVMGDLDIVIEDLREGIYRLIGLKATARRGAAEHHKRSVSGARAASVRGR